MAGGQLHVDGAAPVVANRRCFQGELRPATASRKTLDEDAVIIAADRGFDVRERLGQAGIIDSPFGDSAVNDKLKLSLGRCVVFGIETEIGATTHARQRR